MVIFRLQVLFITSSMVTFILLKYGMTIRGGSKVKKCAGSPKYKRGRINGLGCIKGGGVTPVPPPPPGCAPDYSLVLTFYHSLIRLTLIASKKNHSLEVVSLYHDPQLQVDENYSYLLNLWPNICKSWCLNTHFIPKNVLLYNKRIKDDYGCA